MSYGSSFLYYAISWNSEVALSIPHLNVIIKKDLV
jgi:hypothetical protein